MYNTEMDILHSYDRRSEAGECSQRQQSTPRKKRCTMQLDVYCHEFSRCPDGIWKLKMVSGVWQRQRSLDAPQLQHRRLRGLSNGHAVTRVADGRWARTMGSTRQRGGPLLDQKGAVAAKAGSRSERPAGTHNARSCPAGTGSLPGWTVGWRR